MKKGLKRFIHFLFGISLIDKLKYWIRFLLGSSFVGFNAIQLLSLFYGVVVLSGIFATTFLVTFGFGKSLLWGLAAVLVIPISLIVSGLAAAIIAPAAFVIYIFFLRSLMGAMATVAGLIVFIKNKLQKWQVEKEEKEEEKEEEEHEEEEEEEKQRENLQ